MQPFCDGSHNVLPARKAVAQEAVPPPVPTPSDEAGTKTEAPRPGLLRRLFGRT
jgi:hypothetical protein